MVNFEMQLAVLRQNSSASLGGLMVRKSFPNPVGVLESVSAAIYDGVGELCQ